MGVTWARFSERNPKRYLSLPTSSRSDMYTPASQKRTIFIYLISPSRPDSIHRKWRESGHFVEEAAWNKWIRQLTKCYARPKIILKARSRLQTFLLDA